MKGKSWGDRAVPPRPPVATLGWWWGEGPSASRAGGLGGPARPTQRLPFTSTALTNETDSARLYQYETGAVTTPIGALAGYYNVTRRVTSGGAASALNAASETMKVILATATPGPFSNLTYDGTHDFTSGPLRAA